MEKAEQTGMKGYRINRGGYQLTAHRKAIA